MNRPDSSEHPLQTAADIYPRARHRFFWCAIGLGMGFILTGLWRGWEMVLHVWWGGFIIVIIPAIGAYLDWKRLKQQPPQ